MLTNGTVRLFSAGVKPAKILKDNFVTGKAWLFDGCPLRQVAPVLRALLAGINRE